MVPRSLLVARGRRVALAGTRLRLWRRLHETLLLLPRRELRVRRSAVHGSIPSCTSASSTLLLRRWAIGVLWTGRLDVVVCDVALLGVLGDGRVGFIGEGNDDVPGVKETRKEAET